MLKRNGELCRHKVPDFPGLLTDSEHEAYLEMVEYVEEDIRLCGYRRKFVDEIEKQIPRLKKLADKALPGNAPDFVFRGENWKIIDVFYKVENLWEMYFCSRSTPTEREFAVIQKLYPKSGRIITPFGEPLDSLCMAHGRNPSRVLDEFFENQRFTFEIAQKKLEARIAEDLFKRYSADFCRRICKALAPLYDEHAVIENENVPAEKASAGIKMKL